MTCAAPRVSSLASRLLVFCLFPLSKETFKAGSLSSKSLSAMFALPVSRHRGPGSWAAQSVDIVSFLRCRHLSCRRVFAPASLALQTSHNTAALNISSRFVLSFFPPTNISPSVRLHGSSFLNPIIYLSTGLSSVFVSWSSLSASSRQVQSARAHILTGQGCEKSSGVEAFPLDLPRHTPLLLCSSPLPKTRWLRFSASLISLQKRF